MHGITTRIIQFLYCRCMTTEQKILVFARWKNGASHHFGSISQFCWPPSYEQTHPDHLTAQRPRYLRPKGLLKVTQLEGSVLVILLLMADMLRNGWSALAPFLPAEAKDVVWPLPPWVRLGVWWKPLPASSGCLCVWDISFSLASQLSRSHFIRKWWCPIAYFQTPSHVEGLHSPSVQSSSYHALQKLGGACIWVHPDSARTVLSLHKVGICLGLELGQDSAVKHQREAPGRSWLSLRSVYTGRKLFHQQPLLWLSSFLPVNTLFN